MTKPTREQKRERIKEMLDFFFHKGAEEDDIDRAILADYDAPLSEERRAELEWRRSEIRMLFDQSLELYAKAKTDEEQNGHASDLGSFTIWLAEIDAELEGDDA